MLRNFFGYVIDPPNAVQLFTWHHYMLIGFALLAIYLPLKYSHLIYRSKHEKRIRDIFFYSLIFLEITYHAHNWAGGQITFPLHICSFAVIMNMALLKTNSQRIFEYVFFFGVLGGFIAMFIPFSMGFPYYNFRYYHFIIIHMTIIMIPLYYYKAYHMRVTLHATYKTFFMVLLIMPVMHNINWLIRTVSSTEYINYWFVSEIPHNVETMFNNQLVYIAVLLSMVYTSQMILYKVSNRKKKRKTLEGFDESV